MAVLPPKPCPTLDAADTALEATQDRKLRSYLGMSQIGRPCARETWLSFRWAMIPNFDAGTLKRFADGHATEAVIIERLKLADFLQVHDADENGEQFGFKDLGDHFSGNMDGVALGLIEAPKTWHVLEVKCTAEKKLTELKKIVDRVGEKLALREWNPVYYAQAVLYMHYAELERHWLVVATPGGRDWYSIRTDADPAEAARLIALADRIIFADEAPHKLQPDSMACRRCDKSALCHGNALPERNCRTCLHVTPDRDGGWMCARHELDLSVESQRRGCDDHRFNPTMINAAQIDANDAGVTYSFADGNIYQDCGL